MKALKTTARPAGIMYSSATGLMVMDFAGRGRYIYHDVPSDVYEALKSAAAGVHARFVRQAGHNYSIIDGIAPR